MFPFYANRIRFKWILRRGRWFTIHACVCVLMYCCYRHDFTSMSEHRSNRKGWNFSGAHGILQSLMKKPREDVKYNKRRRRSQPITQPTTQIMSLHTQSERKKRIKMQTFKTQTMFASKIEWMTLWKWYGLDSFKDEFSVARAKTRVLV